MAGKFFRIPWATSGDKNVIPDDTQVDGSVSYQQGFGDDYEKDLQTDPNAKPVPRGESNELYSQITENIRQWQAFGVYPFITAAQNNGVDFPYELNAVMLYTDGCVYESLLAANATNPDTDPSAWAKVSGVYQFVPQNTADILKLQDRLVRTEMLNYKTIETGTPDIVTGFASSLNDGSGIFCGDNGKIVTLGTGGNDPNINTTPTSELLRDIHYHSNITGYVAVGENGSIIRSATGGTWTDETLGGFDWRDVFGSSVMPNPERYVVVGQAGANGYSDDGTTWIQNPALPTAGTLSGKMIFTTETQSAGFYCCWVSDDIFTSNDGVNWTTNTLPGNPSIADVTYSPELNLYVAVGNIGGNGVVYTGTNLNTMTLAYTRPDLLRKVEWGGNAANRNQRFVAVGQIAGGNIGVLYSDDGVTWNEAPRAFVITGENFEISYNPLRRVFVAVGASNMIVSTDGINWRVPNFENGVVVNPFFVNAGDQVGFAGDNDGNILISTMAFVED